MISGLYFVANYKNKATVWEAAEWQNGAEWKQWQRFESIPSSMWFVLINLCKEHPLADKFESFFQRFCVIFVCFIGVPIFAVPTGIFGCILQERASKEVAQADASMHEACALYDEEPDSAPQSEERAGAEMQPRGDEASIESARGLQVDDQPQAAKSWAEEPLEQNVELQASVPPTTVVGLMQHVARHQAEAVAVSLLSFGSVFVYFYYTVGAQTRLFFVPVYVGPVCLLCVDSIVAVIFALEWMWRMSSVGLDYPLSMLGLIDLSSWVPGVIHFFMYMFCGEDCLSPWVRAAIVLRVLKPERYIGGFGSMFSIVVEFQSILLATALVAFLTWLAASTVLYYTERHSPDEDINEYYGSIPRTLWAEVINLHGEWPWPDYSPLGKWIGTYIAFFSTGICMVPIVIFAEGFQRRLEEADEDRHGSGDMMSWQLDHLPTESGIRLDVWCLLYNHLLQAPYHFSCGYRIFRAMSVTMTLLVTTSTVVVTYPWFDPQNCREDLTCQAWNNALYGIDVACMSFFVVEFLLRIFALRGLYLISWVGLADFLSLAALGITLTSLRDVSLHPNYNSAMIADDMVIPVRLLRLVAMESYVPSFFVLGNVVWLNRQLLLKSFYALVCVWYIFGVALYVEENGSKDKEISSRYADALTGLPHALVHMCGDYPVQNYSHFSQFSHFWGLVFGQCVVSAVTGIFTAGFVDYLGDEREMERQRAAERRLNLVTNAVVMLQAKFRRRRRLALQNQGASSSACAVPARKSGAFCDCALDIVQQRTFLGKCIMIFCNAVLIINIINTLAGSVPEVEANGQLLLVLDIIECGCCSVFVVEYVLRVLACRTLCEVIAPMRIFDLLCILPTIAHMVLQSEPHRWQKEHAFWENMIECLLVCRVLRVLEFHCIRREVRLVQRTIGACLQGLMLPGMMAVDIWIISAGMFVWVEGYFKGPEEEHMRSLPDALYWCSIYLLGEWANDEFSDGAGSRLCIFYCLVAVALFSIPIGLVIEVTSSLLRDMAEEDKEIHRLKGVPPGRPPSGLRVPRKSRKSQMGPERSILLKKKKTREGPKMGPRWNF
mmetsp:Transcript_105538/g.209713  ORF Transcript_105538/g.209713 Transcript_105538/m.209713 type:complete len:1061 (+) Transcript_105538:1-3183(+)